MTVVLCVFRESEDFKPFHVERLYNMIERNTNVPFSFYVLTDRDYWHDEKINVIYLYNSGVSPKYCKIELFRPDIFELGEYFFYADLDTVITGNIDDFLATKDTPLIMLEDFYYKGNGASGLMAWSHSLGSQLYHDFVKLSAQDRERNYKIGMGNGDQKFIRDNCRCKIEFWQDLFPGKVISYKVNVRKRNGECINDYDDPRIICFHGKPKIHEITDEWILREWH